MNIKGFADTNKNIETPNDVGVSEKPLKNEQIEHKRVDINILKSKLREKENIVFKKNLFILMACLVFIGVVGIYLTYL